MQAIDTQDKQFHDGNGTTELGTILPAWWLNQIQAELLGVLTAAQIAPNKAKTNQLSEAIQKLFPNKNFTLTAGAGLTGGGDLTANRTLALATPSTLSGSTSNWVGNGATGHTHELAKATGTVAGVVKLINALNSTATDAALTALQGKVLSEQIAAAVSGCLNMRGALAGQNLNDLIGESNYGVWHQSGNANATAERNYPHQTAGTLFVLPSAYQGVQLYIPFDKYIIYIRHSQATGTWSTWRTIGETVNTLDSTSATAALSALQGKVLAERIDNKDSLQTINYADQAALGYHRTGFYRGNGREIDGIATPSMEMHIAHPSYDNNAYARGIGFSYGGNFNLSTTAWDANGRYLGQKTILTELNGVMLTGDQSIAGTKIFTGSLQATGNIMISANGKTIALGTGANDTFINNSKSNKYLQLKDNGELAYSNDKILLYSDRSDAVNLNRTDKIATSAAVKTAYDKAVDALTAANQKANLADFAQSRATNGYQKLPNGLIIQWGVLSGVGGDSYNAVTFPIAFPNTCLNAQSSVSANGAIWGGVVLSSHVGNISKTGCSLGVSENGTAISTNVYWFAIGY